MNTKERQKKYDSLADGVVYDLEALTQEEKDLSAEIDSCSDAKELEFLVAKLSVISGRMSILQKRSTIVHAWGSHQGADKKNAKKVVSESTVYDPTAHIPMGDFIEDERLGKLSRSEILDRLEYDSGPETS